MTDFAIGFGFHKAHRTVVRAVDLKPPCRYFASRDSAGFIALPTLDLGDTYTELQGITQTSFQINDQNQDFRLLGDDGWGDSVITGSSVQASVTTYFIKDAEIPVDTNCPVFRGNYDEGFRLLEKARYDKNHEIYVEFLKEMGRADGGSGNYLYDFTGFNAVIQNYQEQLSAEGLTEVSFDMMSRGRPVFGRYNAGGSAISFGQVQSSILFLVTGTRQAAVSPANNTTGASVGGNITVTYTSDGAIALTELALGQPDGGGFRLENAATSQPIPVLVTLSSNVVTINPTTDLAAGTIFRLAVADGAITQAVDGLGIASPTGIKRPLQGLTSTFRTA